MDLTKHKESAISKEITKTQAKFLDFCEEFGWGKLEVDIKDGQPIGYWVVVKDGVVQHYTKCD